MPTTSQHINARNDLDLQQRFIAMAEMEEIPDAAAWVSQNMSKLVNVDVENGQKVSDVYNYAKEVRDNHIASTPLPPGKNLGAVTDTHISTAIAAINAEPSM
jgi:hypothetical protein